jgi:ankyrin repeat protein
VQLPLHRAVRDGDRGALLAAIAGGAPLDAKDTEGGTALLVAVRLGRADLAKALLDAGAEMDPPPRKLLTRRWTRLAAGCPSEPSGPGSLLHEAAAHDGGAAVVRLLLARGLDPEGRDPDGSTPLMIAAAHAPFEAAPESPLTALLAAGASVDARDRVGYGPLDAAYREHAVALLLAAGADPNGHASSESGYFGQPLIVRWSMGTGSVAIVRRLLDAGAALAAGALAYAAHFGHEDLVDLLLARGYPPDDTVEGVPAIAGASAFARLPIVEALIGAGAKELDAALVCAAGSSRLSAGPDIRERLDDRLAVIRALLAAGASPSPPPGTAAETALHVAAGVGVEAIADLLLEAGAPVEARDGLGRTPLFVAAENGCATIAERLLRAGADPGTTDARGVSAYAVAKRTTTPANVVEIYPGRGAQIRVMGLLREAGAGPPPPPAPPKPAGPSAGDGVTHAKFGAGTIVAVDGSGPDAKLTIDFATAGRKVLMARFVQGK